MIEDKDVVELWWDAVRSDDLLGNGLPHIRYTSSNALEPYPPPQSKKTPKTNKPKVRRKKRARSTTKGDRGTLLGIMNNNIRTMKRVRSTHAKFAALSQSQERNEDSGESPEPGFGLQELILEEGEEDIVIDERPWKSPGNGIEIGEAQAENCLGWMSGKVLEHVGFQGEYLCGTVSHTR